MTVKPNDKFGKLTILKQLEDGKFGAQRYLCRCDCGNEVIYNEPIFAHNHIRSCGCCDEDKSDMIGKRFGLLTILKKVVNSSNGKSQWLTQCDCGKTKIVSNDYLHGSPLPSCGCAHSLTKHPLYDIWKAMKDRCYNPDSLSYKNYGARGIKVCDRWLESFQNFCEDMYEGYKKGLQIDRKDNNGSYTPENCRWATPKENGRNKRNNHLITTALGTKTLAEQAELAGIPRMQIYLRLKAGMPEELSIVPKKGKLSIKILQQLCDFNDDGVSQVVWMDDREFRNVNEVFTLAEFQAKVIKRKRAYHASKGQSQSYQLFFLQV